MSDKPNPIPVSRILDENEFSKGDVIRAVKGKIKKLFSNIRKGQGQSGAYEYQDGIFEDDEGAEIKICFAKCSQPNSAVGKKVYIRSKPTPAHGTQGIKLEEYEGKRSLKITPNAEIEYAGGGGGQASGGTGGAVATGSPGPAKSNAHPREVLKDMIDCHGMVTTLVNEKYPEAGDAFKQGAIQTIFIECTKSGLIPDFLKRYGKKIYPPVPTDPYKWKECVLSKGEFEGKTLAEVPDEALLKLFSYYDDKQDNSPLAECVYQAARDRNILPTSEPEPDPAGGTDSMLDAPEDDIPF